MVADASFAFADTVDRIEPCQIPLIWRGLFVRDTWPPILREMNSNDADVEL